MAKMTLCGHPVLCYRHLILIQIWAGMAWSIYDFSLSLLFILFICTLNFTHRFVLWFRCRTEQTHRQCFGVQTQSPIGNASFTFAARPNTTANCATERKWNAQIGGHRTWQSSTEDGPESDDNKSDSSDEASILFADPWEFAKQVQRPHSQYVSLFPLFISLIPISVLFRLREPRLHIVMIM